MDVLGLVQSVAVEKGINQRLVDGQLDAENFAPPVQGLECCNSSSRSRRPAARSFGITWSHCQAQ